VRLLLVTEFPFPGETGSPLHMMALVAGLTERGHEIRVMRYGGRRTRRIRRDAWRGIEIATLPLATWPIAAGREIARVRPDAIWTHGATGLCAVAPLALAARLPLLHEVHAVPGFDRSAERLQTRVKFWLGARRERHAPRLADEVLVLSERLREELTAAGVDPRRVHVSYPPVDLAHYDWEARAPRAHEPVAVFAGNFNPWQGVDLLLEAIPLVLRERPDARFRLIGGSASELDALRRASAVAGDPRVSLEGRVDAKEIPAALRDGDVAVIPRPDLPINRTTARKLGECLAAGRVLVATDVGDHRRLLEGGDCGLVAECNAPALAASLLQAIDDRTRSLELARRGRAVAEALFASERAAATREALLARFTGPRG
jgi:glycosyltransferase involved in cell wall biosynthesis